MPAVGVIFPPWFSPETLRGAAATAESCGIPELWVWEDCFCESGLATAVAALAWTEQIELRVGLLPVPLRNVALTAMEVATIDRMFPGRFQPVLGHGVQSWMRQAGGRVASPVTLLREYLTALERLLAGERVSVKGRYVALEEVKLMWPPTRPMQVFAGATGPATLWMLGEVASGVLIDSGTSPQDLRGTVDLLRRAAQGAGRQTMPEVVLYAHAVIGDDARNRLIGILGDLPDDPELRRGACGSPEEIADAIRRWKAAGADHVVLRPPEDDPDIVGYFRFVGEQVVPLT